MMSDKNQHKTLLSVNKGVENLKHLEKHNMSEFKNKKKTDISSSVFFKEISKGNILYLSKAVTLIESTKREHVLKAQEIINKCLPISGNSIRIGLTGVPGVGKSSFIESLGMFLVNQGKKVAVLAVDPSGKRSGGSILGDKTRMEQLSVSPNAYIRPSPSGGNLGGVARKTAETVILCEAAGFDIIFIETVGVGQSETAVHSMVDFFLLLILAGAGDQLQGIKRGITESADAIVINKADGDNIIKAESAKNEYQNALHYFPPSESSWVPKVVTASALTGAGIEDVWDIISDYVEFTQKNDYFFKNRKMQAKFRMFEMINEEIKRRFFENEEIKTKLKALEIKVIKGEISPYSAANEILNEQH